ncbi:MAG TPA: MgtC/SapB family protein [Chloroflexota bacterium]|nr:MgtC/SapB family protein [Chloroflexota bacterium]
MTAVTPFEELEVLGRMALACVLAGALGWERQMGQQPAGLRTHMLVSLGSAAFTIAGIYGVAGHGTVQDAGRIAAQIVVGIGFIGAGSIWRSSGNERVIRGLTTAASIWVAASIGMMCGYGLYVLAVGSALISLVVLRLLRGLERIPGTILRSFAPRRTAAEVAADDAADAALDGDSESPALPHVLETPIMERQRKRRRGKSGKKKKRKPTDELADVISDAS